MYCPCNVGAGDIVLATVLLTLCGQLVNLTCANVWGSYETEHVEMGGAVRKQRMYKLMEQLGNIIYSKM